MTALLVALLVSAAPARHPAAVVRHEEPDPSAVRHLSGPQDVAALCTTLTPSERLRGGGDAVEQGQRASRHEEERDAALAGRYQIALPATKLPFAPYEAADRRLLLADPATLAVGGGPQLWATADRELPVHVDAATARRILEVQRAGRLGLVLVFDLPDDATCGGDPRRRNVSLPVEPVEWSFRDGDQVLARGNAAADRPALDLASGARPHVDVGEPIAGPSETKKGVLARKAELETCYREALRKDPGVDGVLVVEVSGPGHVTVAADSTGAPELAACVTKALASVPPPPTGRAAVPIRFELVAPTASPAPVASP